MSTITVELPDGTREDFIHSRGITFSAAYKKIFARGDLSGQLDMVKNLEIRPDDVYLATFPKSGTHWVWEIIMMLRKGNSEYEVDTKESVFLDYIDEEHVASLPSPRVLNCHFPLAKIPRGILENGNKIIHVMRNPKDVFVSYFHHKRTNNQGQMMTSFPHFLPLMLGEYGICYFYPWCKYVKEWEKFAQVKPEQVLNLSYEDLKEDPVREIKKINDFLGCGRDDELVQQIADACSFDNLKKADAEIKVNIMRKRDPTKKPINMYRKGQVGDWKNWLTVAQNEQMDAWLEENMADSDLNIRYTL